MTVRDERGNSLTENIISEKIKQYLSSRSRAGAINLSGCSTSMHRLEVDQVRGRSRTSMRARRDSMLALGKTRHASVLVNLAENAAILLIKLSQFNDIEITLEIEVFLISKRYSALHKDFK